MFTSYSSVVNRYLLFLPISPILSFTGYCRTRVQKKGVALWIFQPL
nr:MAG TPA: hypothetical protein [Caudoviricetes sp.]